MTRLKDAELSALQRALEANRSATHDRPLHGHYSYERILGIDLVQRCVAAIERSATKVRVLDIGCGDGWAVNQLEQELRRRRLDAHYELYGLGMNRYSTMHIDSDHFIQSGINQLVHAGPRFDLIFSVFTFHYVPHKIEAIEMIYNYLLAEHGEAHIHFPGFLVRIEDAPQLGPEAGNKAFAEFLTSPPVRACAPEVRFRIIPHYDYCDDDDLAEIGSFGVLSMKRTDAWLDFGLLYTDCALVPHGPQLVYVSTEYLRTRALYDRTTVEKRTLTRRVTESKEYMKAYQFDIELDLCIHRCSSPHIIINYPGASRSVDGIHGRFKAVAAEIQDRQLSAVVRANNPFIRRVDYPSLLTENLRYVIDYVLAHAEEICDTASPELYLMGHSAGASAAGAVAGEYAEIKKLLLMAPSLDAGKDAIRKGLREFKGDLRIVVGMEDTIVLPVYSRFFHHAAVHASVNKFVALWHCDHDFGGARNYDLLRKAPRWAFFDDPDFPDGDDSVDPEEVIYR